MALMITNQLDFIIFFYGLAFILLGAVCFSLARGGHDTPWAMLGTFGYIHGIGEWLDLSALVIGDVPAYAMGRTIVMSISFLFLCEFARLEALRLGYKAPGRWIYALLLLPVAVGLTGGLNVGNALARYLIGFPGAIGTGLVLALQTSGATGRARSIALAAAAGFALYAIAAGIIVPVAPFWPASVLNYDSFMRAADMPIQLVRGVLACGIAFTVWAFWGQLLIRAVASPRYARFMHQQFFRTLAAMGAILVCGWVLTDFLGDIYKQNIQTVSRGDIDLVSSRLAGETATIEGMVKALAGDTSVHALLAGGEPRPDSVNSVLSLHLEASRGKFGYILDLGGTIVAFADSRGVFRDEARNFSDFSFFQKAIAGEAGHDFVFANGEQNYYASYPVRGARGSVIGVAVLAKSLDVFEHDLRQFDRPVFLVDGNGVVTLTNRPGMMLRTLWPLSDPAKQTVGRVFGTVDTKPLFDAEVSDGTWIAVGGTRDYVRRRFADHSDWSLVLLTVPRGIFASRVLGIIITLQMATLTLVYLVGRERWIHDDVQLGNRLKLEETARNLNLQAVTDSLTGLYNRSKFNQEFAIEILRAERYKSPLALVLFDIDHFKRINDTFGHPAGDAALVQVSRFLAAHVRKVDLLARWGGEEFVILAPGANAMMAKQLADNLRDQLQQLDIEDAPGLTCSFGVAEYQDGDTAEAVVARADEALYRAKVNGRDRVEVAPQPGLRALHSVA